MPMNSYNDERVSVLFLVVLREQGSKQGSKHGRIRTNSTYMCRGSFKFIRGGFTILTHRWPFGRCSPYR